MSNEINTNKMLTRLFDVVGEIKNSLGDVLGRQQLMEKQLTSISQGQKDFAEVQLEHSSQLNSLEEKVERGVFGRAFKDDMRDLKCGIATIKEYQVQQGKSIKSLAAFFQESSASGSSNSSEQGDSLAAYQRYQASPLASTRAQEILSKSADGPDMEGSSSSPTIVNATSDEESCFDDTEDADSTTQHDALADQSDTSEHQEVQTLKKALADAESLMQLSQQEITGLRAVAEDQRRQLGDLATNLSRTVHDRDLLSEQLTTATHTIARQREGLQFEAQDKEKLRFHYESQLQALKTQLPQGGPFLDPLEVEIDDEQEVILAAKETNHIVAHVNMVSFPSRLTHEQGDSAKFPTASAEVQVNTNDPGEKSNPVDSPTKISETIESSQRVTMASLLEQLKFKKSTPAGSLLTATEKAINQSSLIPKVEKENDEVSVKEEKPDEENKETETIEDRPKEEGEVKEMVNTVPDETSFNIEPSVKAVSIPSPPHATESPSPVDITISTIEQPLFDQKELPTTKAGVEEYLRASGAVVTLRHVQILSFAHYYPEELKALQAFWASKKIPNFDDEFTAYYFFVKQKHGKMLCLRHNGTYGGCDCASKGKALCTFDHQCLFCCEAGHGWFYKAKCRRFQAYQRELKKLRISEQQVSELVKVYSR